MKLKPTLGYKEGRLLSILDLEGVTVLNLTRDRELLPFLTDAELADALYRLQKKGWLEHIERGKYLVVPRAGVSGWDEHPFLIVDALLDDDYYVSYWTALAHYGLTEQLPTTVFVALREARKRSLVFHQRRYRFVAVPLRRFFGAIQGQIGEHSFRIAKVEKALLDALHQERYGGGIIEIAKCLYNAGHSMDIDKLVSYAVRMDSKVLCRRLGYLMETVGLPESQALLPHIGRGPMAYLSTVLPKRTRSINDKWKLLINVPKEVLLEWREVW